MNKTTGLLLFGIILLAHAGAAQGADTTVKTTKDSAQKQDSVPAPILNNVADDGSAVKGSFSEPSGMEVEVDAVDYRTGAEDKVQAKIPGLKKTAKDSFGDKVSMRKPQPPDARDIQTTVYAEREKEREEN